MDAENAVSLAAPSNFSKRHNFADRRWNCQFEESLRSRCWIGYVPGYMPFQNSGA